MKTVLYILLSAFMLSSCDVIFKDHSEDNQTTLEQKPVILGTDKDDKGCVTSAGYMWSQTRKACIRVFEEGYRLAPYQNQEEAIEEDNEQATLNAYVVFGQDKYVAELFLPNSKQSILLKRENEDKPYVDHEWVLEAWKTYVLKKRGEIVYTSAVTVEKKITGSDVGE